MEFTIIIPHWKTGKMTAYTLYQLLKYKGNHKIDIVVVDNNAGDGSLEYLLPFLNEITIVEYPKEKLQSHGIAFDYVLPHIKTERFITIESDSFPTKADWLNYYELLAIAGFDCAGSLLKLSGGTYIHPAGAVYKKSVWQECKNFCDSLPYAYFPNMSMKEGFACHLMVHDSIFDDFEKNPEDYIELADGYKPYTPIKAIERLEYYKPVCGPFHHGIGSREESKHTYGSRTIETDSANLLNISRKIINRIGYEPGQMFCYWQAAMGKKIFEIPTEVKWIDGKVGQQQEYTIMENGFKHCWGVSAYHGTNLADSEVARIKQAIPEQLYESLPNEYKIC